GAKATWVASNAPPQMHRRRSPASSDRRMAIFSGRSPWPGCLRTSVTRMVTGPVVVVVMPAPPPPAPGCPLVPPGLDRPDADAEGGRDLPVGHPPQVEQEDGGRLASRQP